jgi:hypothetical protein
MTCNYGGVRCGLLHAMPFIHYLSSQPDSKNGAGQYSVNAAFKNQHHLWEGMGVADRKSFIGSTFPLAEQLVVHYVARADVDEQRRLRVEISARPKDGNLRLQLGDLLMRHGMHAAAAQQYLARVALGRAGDADGLYRAHLGAARALEANKAGTGEFADHYAAAADVQPLRKEAFYHMAVIHRQLDNMRACYSTISQAAAQGPAPPGAGGVDAFVYELGVDEELCTCAFYAKAYFDGLEACNRVIETLEGGKFPERAGMLGRIRRNIEHHEKALEAEADDDEYAD